MSENITKYVGSKIREHRKRKKFTQEQLGKMLALRNNTISNYESGKNDIGSENLYRVAKTLGINVGDLFPSDSKNDNELSNKDWLHLISDLKSKGYTPYKIQRIIDVVEEINKI